MKCRQASNTETRSSLGEFRLTRDSLTSEVFELAMERGDVALSQRRVHAREEGINPPLRQYRY